MADSPGSSVLSDPPSGGESEGNSSRRSLDGEHGRPHKRRRTGHSSHTAFERAPSSQPGGDGDDDIQLSDDTEGSAPASPFHHSGYALRDDAQTQCLWRDCDFGEGLNNDDLVQHVQNAHCITTGPKKTKYVCEWGECQRKTSNHPSGYALKAHMRSHTKEKPYYCALPECDKAFTRSDALAKHMRTVHEPEPLRVEVPTTGKRGIKLKLANGTAKLSNNGAGNSNSSSTAADLAKLGPTHDEDGNPVDPSPASDNIAYLPARHPLTGQPGFMINYPPDIDFTQQESTFPADQLMRVLRRQVHWAEQEAKALAQENETLERMRREEWMQKEVLLEGMLEAELHRGKRLKLFRRADRRAKRAMEADIVHARRLPWTNGDPIWRLMEARGMDGVGGGEGNDEDDEMDEDDAERLGDGEALRNPYAKTPSPPPTARSGGGGGFDGDADPYDNYLAGRMAEYEERERLRSLQNTPQKSKAEQQAAEADAVGALMGLSGN